jgi:GTPase SAR1 family protein
VGLHGMGGVGKTTISKALCNQMFGDFCGKVCHIELGGNDMKSRKKVLRELTGASSEILNNDKDKVRFSDKLVVYIQFKYYQSYCELWLVSD